MSITATKPRQGPRRVTWGLGMKAGRLAMATGLVAADWGLQAKGMVLISSGTETAETVARDQS